jgi:hypothetical protein
MWLLPKILFKPQLEYITHAGWHFNNLFLVNDVIDKIESSAHQEFNKRSVKDQALEHFLSGRDIYTGREYCKVEIDSTFPSAVTQNLEKWKIYMLD